MMLPGVPEELVMQRYAAAPGNEISKGKFASPESSAALVANTFGLFLKRAPDLPALPGCEDLEWPASSVDIEVTVHFPWPGGRHPWLDVLIETPTAIIGIESKRFEPFRPGKAILLSRAYWRSVWGESMSGYQRIRDGLDNRSLVFAHLDAAQLFKHALGLRTAVNANSRWKGKRAILVYLYAEPKTWPDGRAIPPGQIDRHRTEIARFTAAVSGDEVEFRSCSYRALLAVWAENALLDIQAHAEAVSAHFQP